VARASTSELPAAEAQLNDTSPSLTLEAGTLVPDSRPAGHPTVVLSVLCVAQFLSVKGAIIPVASLSGEGWEYRRHGFLVSLPRRAGAARRACS
jgi:hypothetical protein